MADPIVPTSAIQLVNEHRRAGRLPEAEQTCREALRQWPGEVELRHLLGMLCCEAGRAQEALELIQQVIEAQPGNARVWQNMGTVLGRLGRDLEATNAFARAVELEPVYVEALANLAAAMQRLGRFTEAEAAARRVIKLKPQRSGGHVGLGTALTSLGRVDEAIDEFRQALLPEPGAPEAWKGLLAGLERSGRTDELLESYRRAVSFLPNDMALQSGLLCSLLYTGWNRPEATFEAHRQWGQRQSARLKPMVAIRSDGNWGRRIRIGYVSTDFREHPTARFIMPIIARHDRDEFEVYVYADVPRPDAVTNQARQSVDAWRDLTGISEEKAAELIRSDRIRILVDLSGHMARSRLGLFAYRPAPVQVAYCGYPFTTGMSEIGWRITDRHVDPPGLAEHLYTEQLIRPAECFLTYDVMADDLAVTDLPSEREGRVTFAVLNRMVKVRPTMIRLWARILAAVPRSRLMIKPGLDPAGNRQIVALFKQNGICADRLYMVERRESRKQYLELWNEADIGLDTFPYHGTATTCDGLWMGVPTVTLAGDSCVSRTGITLLRAVDCENLVAKNADEYVTTAVSLASNLAGLAELRKQLRTRMKQSPLCDYAGFTAALETEFRKMWETRCSRFQRSCGDAGD